MSITFAVTAAGLMMTGLQAAIDAAGIAGYVECYDGARPSAGGTPAGVLVVAFPFDYPSGSVDASGSLVLGAGLDGLVQVTSTPTWARIFTGADDRVGDCDCRLSSAPDGGEEIVIDAPSLTAGAFVKIASGGFAVPIA